jgi:hypothetical protein
MLNVSVPAPLALRANSANPLILIIIETTHKLEPLDPGFASALHDGMRLHETRADAATNISIAAMPAA